MDTATPTEEDKSLAVEAEVAKEAGSEEAGSGDDSTQPKPEDKEKQDEFKRLRRRNEKLLQDRASERARAEALSAEVERLKQAQAAKEDDEDDKPAKAEDPRKLAEQLVTARETAAATKRILKEASGKFPEFEKNIAELVEEVGPLIDGKTGAPSPLLEAVFDSESSAEVLNYLGENPEVAAELMGLSQARIGRRIAKIESDLAAKAKPKTSAAPKPLAPVKPAAQPQVDPAKLTDKQWAEMRRKERERA